MGTPKVFCGRVQQNYRLGPSKMCAVAHQQAFLEIAKECSQGVSFTAELFILPVSYLKLMSTEIMNVCMKFFFYRCTVHFEDSLSITPTNALL